MRTIALMKGSLLRAFSFPNNLEISVLVNNWRAALNCPDLSVLRPERRRDERKKLDHGADFQSLVQIYVVVGKFAVLDRKHGKPILQISGLSRAMVVIRGSAAP